MSASQRFEMLASAAQIGSGNSAAFPVPTMSMLMVGVDITLVSGTTPTLGIWLQGSDDGGTTWYDLPYDLQMTSFNAAADVTAFTARRNINGSALAAVISKHVAIYQELPTDTVRLAWIIGGTATPTFTFSASAVGK